MSNRLTRTAVIGLLIVLVLSLGALAVFAQDGAVPDGTPAGKTMPFGRDGFHGAFDKPHGRGGYNGANDEALASALGITVEELQAARQKVAADRLAQAVEDGYLTQDQANLLLAKQALAGYLDRQALMAEAFGMTVEEFEAARENGELRDLMSNITPADLQANMQAAMEKALSQAVADNVITQSQADLMLAEMANGPAAPGNFGDHHGFGGMRGGHHDFHGFRGAPQDSDAGEAYQAPFGAFQNAPASGA